MTQLLFIIILPVSCVEAESDPRTSRIHDPLALRLQTVGDQSIQRSQGFVSILHLRDFGSFILQELERNHDHLELLRSKERSAQIAQAEAEAVASPDAPTAACFAFSKSFQGSHFW